MQSDELVVRAVAGKPGALQALLLRHYDFVLHIVRQQLPMDLERYVDPEDIVQNTHIVAFRKIQTLEAQTDAAFRAWLRTIAVRSMGEAIDHYRAQKRGGLQREPGFGEGDETVIAILNLLARNSKSPGSIAGDREYLKLIAVELSHLPPDVRQAIELHFLSNLPYPDIATKMGKTEAAVKMMCMRGLRRLRRMLPLNRTVG